MAPAKTLYVRDDDVPLWDRAESAARTWSLSLSQIVAAALRDYLARKQQPAATEEITVEVGDREGHRWHESFSGTWLFEPSDDQRFGSNAGACYGIALTRKGKIAVYSYHLTESFPPGLRVYETVGEAVTAEGLDPEFEPQLHAAAGADVVVRHDW